MAADDKPVDVLFASAGAARGRDTHTRALRSAFSALRQTHGLVVDFDGNRNLTARERHAKANDAKVFMQTRFMLARFMAFAVRQIVLNVAHMSSDGGVFCSFAFHQMAPLLSRGVVVLSEVTYLLFVTYATG